MALFPYLLYEDVEGAMKFLAKAFGFKQHGQTMTDSNGKINHAELMLGGDMVLIGCPGPKYKNPRRLRHSTQSLYIMLPNVDKHFQRAKKAGAEILEKPNDTDYGHRRYGAMDPEGHRWYFAQEIKKPAVKKRTTKRARK